jgi:hypothetical protein
MLTGACGLDPLPGRCIYRDMAEDVHPGEKPPPSLNVGRRSPAAERALMEAVARRKARDSVPASAPGETGGRSGPDPVRYGDWEVNGIACDF